MDGNVNGEFLGPCHISVDSTSVSAPSYINICSQPNGLLLQWEFKRVTYFKRSQHVLAGSNGVICGQTCLILYAQGSSPVTKHSAGSPWRQEFKFKISVFRNITKQITPASITHYTQRLYLCQVLGGATCFYAEVCVRLPSLLNQVIFSNLSKC